jgi:putative molybdopterin biosynthesis protein
MILMKARKNKMKEVFSISELAERWGLRKRTLYKMVDRGELKAFKVANKFRVTLDEVKRIESQSVK